MMDVDTGVMILFAFGLALLLAMLTILAIVVYLFVKMYTLWRDVQVALAKGQYRPGSVNLPAPHSYHGAHPSNWNDREHHPTGEIFPEDEGYMENNVRRIR